MNDPKIITEALAWRYATKEFDSSKKIDDATLDLLLESMRLTASSYGLQPWKFIVVDDPAIRAQLKTVAWEQSQVVDASHLIVLARPTEITLATVEKYIAHIAQVRGIPAETLDGFKSMIADTVSRRSQEELANWASRQIYIALGTLLETAALLGIDGCPMEGFDNAKFDEILGLKEKGLASVVICPIGHRSDNDKMAALPKVRFPKEEVVLHI